MALHVGDLSPGLLHRFDRLWRGGGLGHALLPDARPSTDHAEVRGDRNGGGVEFGEGERLAFWSRIYWGDRCLV